MEIYVFDVQLDNAIKNVKENYIEKYSCILDTRSLELPQKFCFVA